MNKIIRICMVLMLAMSIAACGSKEPAAQQNEKQGETQIPNPWIDCGTLEEAAQIAGFDMKVPDRIDGYPNTMIQAMDKSVIQVFYSDKALGEEGCKTVLIRKGLGLLMCLARASTVPISSASRIFFCAVSSGSSL